MQLRTFEILKTGPKDLQTLAAQMNLSEPAARTLLMGAASLKLLRALPGDRFALADLGAAMNGNSAIEAFVEHHDLVYADLADPVRLLRGEVQTNLSGFWPYASNRPGPASGVSQEIPDGAPRRGASGAACLGYSDLMSRTQALVSEAILDAYPFARHRRLLDVGGGNGAFLAAVARRAPRLELRLFDLPEVAALASAKFARLGIAARAEAVGGDMLRDELPSGADVISLVRVLHDHDDESARRILAAARSALPKNGALIVAEPMAGVRGAEPMGHAYFGLYLAAMGRGRPRTEQEIGKLLGEAGFGRVRGLKTQNPLLVSAVAALRM